MKKTAFSLLALLALAPAFAAEATSPWSFNAGAVSDYRYRGISQTRLQPVLQGGVDYAAPAGFSSAWRWWAPTPAARPTRAPSAPSSWAARVPCWA
ncbi:TorF family putative porin [Roseateles sp. DXS20W]|uniref:TorF family putative porin n=1 Tax=Pelomonas lactea TaxID=3299030 RepID=A0ABW7GI27_9BURK